MTESANGYPAAWRTVTKSNPCPKCEKPDWCRISSNGEFCACRRHNDGTGEHRTSKKDGGEYWIYRLKPPENGWPAPRFKHTDSGGKVASAEVLDRVYSAILERLPLEKRHIEDLDRRGFATETESAGKVGKVLGYRTLPEKGRAKVLKSLIDAGMEEQFPGVPGLFVQERNSSRYWTIGGWSGLLLPTRNHKRQIVALKVRLDAPTEGGKYRALSTKNRGGTGPGSPIHFPIFTGSTETIGVTEGTAKADLATQKTGRLYVGLPSVNAHRKAVRICRLLKAKTVRVAFDADSKTNRNVAQCLSHLVNSLRKAGFAVELETWDIKDGKGIDDLLAAGKEPVVVTGDKELQEAVERIVSTANLADPPPAVRLKGHVNEELDDPHRLARLWLLKEATHVDGRRLAYYREQCWRWNGDHYRACPDAEIRACLAGFCKRQLDGDNREIIEVLPGFRWVKNRL